MWGEVGALPYLWRVLVVLGLEYTEFCRRRRITAASAQLCSVETGGFDTNEDPVFGWQGGLGPGVVDGEARGRWVSTGGCEDGGGHGAGGFVGPGWHDGCGDGLGEGRRGWLAGEERGAIRMGLPVCDS